VTRLPFWSATQTSEERQRRRSEDQRSLDPRPLIKTDRSRTVKFNQFFSFRSCELILDRFSSYKKKKHEFVKLNDLQIPEI